MYFSAGPSITALASAKGKKRENIEHKIDKIFFADSTNFLLIGKNARLTKNGGSIKKAQKFNLNNFVNYVTEKSPIQPK